MNIYPQTKEKRTINKYCTQVSRFVFHVFHNGVWVSNSETSDCSGMEQIGKYIVNDENQVFFYCQKRESCKEGRWERLGGALRDRMEIGVTRRTPGFLCRHRNRRVYACIIA